MLYNTQSANACQAFFPFLPHTIKNMVNHAFCSTFLMRQAIKEEDNIVVIPIKPAYFINSGIVMKKGKPIYSDEQALLDFLKNSYAKQVEK